MTTSEIMKLIDLSQQDIAIVLDIHQSAISHFITGRHGSPKVAYALDKLASLPPGTAMAAYAKKHAERRARAQARLASLGLDLTMPPAEEATDPQAAK